MQHIQKTLKTLTILLAIFFHTNYYCQIFGISDSISDLKKGKLTYFISGEETNSSWELEILFNEENALIKEKYARNTGRKYIYDKKSNEILAFFDDVATFGFKRQSYFFYYTPDELIKEELSSHYGDTTIFKTLEFKDILGYKCQKYIIKHGKQVEVEVWLTDKIKVGIIYPWSPLTFDKIALEYEMKILGKTAKKYYIKSISSDIIDTKVFEHIIPDKYYLIIPISVFSTNESWSSKYIPNNFKSFTYPFLKENRELSIEIIKNGLAKIMMNNKNSLTINFFVNYDGSLSDFNIYFDFFEDDKKIEEIEKFLRSLGKWTPAKVKGKPVKSKVVIYS